VHLLLRKNPKPLLPEKQLRNKNDWTLKGLSVLTVPFNLRRTTLEVGPAMRRTTLEVGPAMRRTTLEVDPAMRRTTLEVGPAIVAGTSATLEWPGPLG
jgi:hypothetical protein